MSKGRPPKDHRLRLVHGDTRKGAGDEPPKTPAPVAETEVPKPPAQLRRHGKAAWKRAITEMTRAGILSRLDLDVLFVYCDLWETILELRRDVRKKDGRVYETESGYERPTERAKQLAAAQKEFRQYAALLGLAPNARRGLAVNEDAEPTGLDAMLDKLQSRGG